VFGKILPRSRVVQGIAGTLFVGIPDPVTRDFSSLAQGFAQIRIAHVISVLSVEPFDMGILFWLARNDELELSPLRS
jgi:hypothetical protein